MNNITHKYNIYFIQPIKESICHDQVYVHTYIYIYFEISVLSGQNQSILVHFTLSY